MIRGRVAGPDSPDLVIRNVIRVVVETDPVDDPSGRRLVYVKHPDDSTFGEGWYDPHADADHGGIPSLGNPYPLDVPRHIAEAIYQALRDHFEPAEAVPVASDRAYGDARTDIDRLHGLVDRLVAAVVAEPRTVRVAPEAVELAGGPDR